MSLGLLTVRFVANRKPRLLRTELCGRPVSLIPLFQMTPFEGHGARGFVRAIGPGAAASASAATGLTLWRPAIVNALRLDLYRVRRGLRALRKF